MSKNVALKPFKPGSKFNGWKIVEPVGGISDNGAAYKVLKEKLPYLLIIQKCGHDEILNYEIHVLQEMAKVSARHILQIEETGQFFDDFSYVVLTLVGKTLNDLREYNNKFSRGTAVLIAIQCLITIENFHENGYFLRDIKPSNFAIGRSEFDKLREIYLKNVYMAKKYKNHDGNVRDVFWPAKPRLHLRYAPIAYHKQEKIRFIDEIESWFYMIVEWTCGQLPWKHLKDTNRDEILRIKEDFLTNGEQFLDECPQEYHQILLIINATKRKDFFDKHIYEKAKAYPSLASLTFWKSAMSACQSVFNPAGVVVRRLNFFIALLCKP
uniref:Protein kinase domain-containing protein n=1 Tax=Panagrolaimus sp. PS1159 TaxID=55785 RepID=A0AC35FK48_9BILA